jgi:hypothetical protein
LFGFREEGKNVIKRKTGDTNNTFELNPSHLVICKRCGCEFSMLPNAKKKVICPRCNKAFNRSSFVPLTVKRKLWVSQEILAQYYEKVAFPQVKSDFACAVEFFRTLTCKAGETRMTSRDLFALGCAVGMKSAYSIDMPADEVWKLISEKIKGTVFFDLLDSVQVSVGAARGRHPRPERLLLLVDALLLGLCPNGYLSFLCDALTLRSKDYAITKKYARAHQDRWTKFHKARRGVEVYCRRIWKNLFGIEPEPVPAEWWMQVARQQGLMEGEYKPFDIM